MKRVETQKSLFFTILAALLVIACVTYASTSTTKIDVHFQHLTYIFNGVEKSPPEEQKGFIYNGTTYVPLRFVAEALNQRVEWDQDRLTITVTPKTGANGIRQEANDAKLQEAYRKIAELERQLKIQEQPSAQTGGWITYETKNLILHFTPEAYEKYGYLHSEAESMLTAHESYFGANTLKQKVELWIHDRNGIFKMNSISFFEPKHNAIKLAADENFAVGGEESVRFVYAHEMAHAYQHQLWNLDKIRSAYRGRMNFLLEGQADYVAKKVLGYAQYGSMIDPTGDARNLYRRGSCRSLLLRLRQTGRNARRGV